VKLCVDERSSGATVEEEEKTEEIKNAKSLENVIKRECDCPKEKEE